MTHNILSLLKNSGTALRATFIIDNDLLSSSHLEEAQHIIDLIIRQMNGIISDFENDPDDISPIFMAMVYPGDPHEYTDAEMWAYGFILKKSVGTRGIRSC